jgi:quercetin dioxygenase-like cupin family protein
MERIHRAGETTQRSPDGIASRPFWVEMLAEAIGDHELGAMRATLGPDTITRWHSHPRGQILYVLSGVGLAQREDGQIEELRAGDCIAFAPDERHWHGSTDTTTFVYVSVQGARNGSAATWFEPVDRS